MNLIKHFLLRSKTLWETYIHPYVASIVCSLAEAVTCLQIVTEYGGLILFLFSIPLLIIPLAVTSSVPQNPKLQ